MTHVYPFLFIFLFQGSSQGPLQLWDGPSLSAVSGPAGLSQWPGVSWWQGSCSIPGSFLTGLPGLSDRVRHSTDRLACCVRSLAMYTIVYWPRFVSWLIGTFFLFLSMLQIFIWRLAFMLSLIPCYFPIPIPLLCYCMLRCFIFQSISNKRI